MSSEPKIMFRLAQREDIPKIVKIFAQDNLIGNREEFTDPLPERYFEYFDKINQSPDNELIVAVLDESVAGTLQITYIPSLLFKGGIWALIEAVNVSEKVRGRGVGSRMMKWALNRARDKGCSIAELSSNKKRDAAHRFYERLGFTATHEGFKMVLK